MIGADDPFLLFCAAAVATCVTLLLARVGFSFPRSALASSYVILLVAGTKLRLRSVSASLRGELDAQIVAELSLYAAISIIVAFSYLPRWRALKPPAPAEILLFGYVLLALSSVLWSTIPSLTAVRALQLLILYGLAFVSVRILGSEGVVRAASVSLVFYVLTCAGAVASGLSAAGSYSATDFFGFSRFSWFSLHPITAATYAALAALAVLAAALSSPFGWSDRRLGIPAWLCIGPLFLILVMTFSRGPLLAALAAASVLILKKVRLGSPVGLAATATVVVVIVAILGASNPGEIIDSDNPIARAFRRGQNTNQLIGLSGRVALWEAAVPVFLDSPAFGHGYHGSRPILLLYASWAATAHNAFLQTLLDLGIAGCLLLLPVIGWVVLTSLLRPRLKSGPIAGQQGFVLVTALFLFINGLTSESFASTPGYDILLVFICTSLVSQAGTGAVKDLTVSQGPRLMTTVTAGRRSLHVRSTERNDIGRSRRS